MFEWVGRGPIFGRRGSQTERTKSERVPVKSDPRGGEGTGDRTDTGWSEESGIYTYFSIKDFAPVGKLERRRN